MYRLTYKNPLEDGGWIVVSNMERGLVTDPDEEFLRIEDLATGKKL